MHTSLFLTPLRYLIARAVLAVCALVMITGPSGFSQVACKRLMIQDTSINNLVDPPGYHTASLGTLGGVVKSGIGTQPMILIPGLGFSGKVFDDFSAAMADRYRTYAVTLAGFGGTPAPPCPPESTSFAAQTWTNGALAAIEKLMVDEKIANPIIVGHWLTGTQLAVRLALNHPGSVKAVILLTAAPRFNVTDTNYARYYSTPEKRVATLDKLMGARWFKFVTRETWDDNNFFPADYAVHPVRGMRLWREAASPKLHVWIRYLCEFEAQDLTLDIDKLKVPTLILNPGYEGLWFDPNNNYMVDAFGYKGWGNTLDKNANIISRTIPNARACLWFDQPEEVSREVKDFISALR